MKAPKKYSKKAKKIVKKYYDGGVASPFADTEVDAMDPSLNKYLLQNDPNATIAPEIVNPIKPKRPSLTPAAITGIGGAAAGVGAIGSEIIDKNVDVDPVTGKNAIGKEVGMDALKRAGQGAAIGSALGPIGLAVGAGVGAIGGVAEGLISGRKKKQAIQEKEGQRIQDVNANNVGKAYGFKKGGKIIKAGTQNKTPFKAMGGSVGIGLPLGPSVDATMSTKKKKKLYANGGKIEGKGTAKSDSIDAEVQQGSFIVPAENSSKAEKLRAKYLGNPDKKAKLKDGGGVDVMLSNGEHMFTPEEVKILKKQGVDVEALAPNADDTDAMKAGGMVKKKFTIKKKYQDGGEVDENGDPIDDTMDSIDQSVDADPTDSEEEQDTSTDNTGDDTEVDEGYKKGGKVKGYQDGGDIIEPSSFEDQQNKAIASIDEKKIQDEPHVVGGINEAAAKKADAIIPAPENAGKKIFDALGGVAGIASLGQTGLGLAQLYGRKRPVGQVDAQLLKQQSEALNEAKTGLSPEENAIARQDIENTRRADVKNIIGLSGGSAGTALSNIGAAGSRANRGLLDLGVKDQQLKRAKQQRADTLTGEVARNKRQLLLDDLNAFNQNQQAAGQLTQAGLSNFFGSIQAQKNRASADARAAKYGDSGENIDYNSLLKYYNDNK